MAKFKVGQEVNVSSVRLGRQTTGKISEIKYLIGDGCNLYDESELSLTGCCDEPLKRKAIRKRLRELAAEVGLDSRAVSYCIAEQLDKLADEI